MKQCFKCLRSLPKEAFYRHPQMADGRLNKCKDCAKIDTRQWYALTRDARASYDLKRDRTAERRRQRQEAGKRHRQKHPDRAAARTAVSNAVKRGDLIRQPCQLCGATKSQAHHRDYSRPLDVEWMCFRCHREVAHQQQLRLAS